MAKKRETEASGGFLKDLRGLGYFRKISDRVQVGIPDIVGSFSSRFFGFEIKAVDEVPRDGMVPLRSSHTFSLVQVLNLLEIEESGGVGVGVVICGTRAVYAYEDEITDAGQVNFNELVTKDQQFFKEKGVWKLREKMKQMKKIQRKKTSSST